MNTHNEQWWQWWLSIHSPTRELRLRDARDWLQFLGPSVHNDTSCLYLVRSLLYQVETLRPKESSKVTSQLALGQTLFKKCLCSCFNKMEERSNIFYHILLYYFKKGKNGTKTHRKRMRKGLCSAWRRCCDWVNASKSKVCKVSLWKFSLDDAPWLGRPVEVARDQIKSLIENSQHYTT